MRKLVAEVLLVVTMDEGLPEIYAPAVPQKYKYDTLLLSDTHTRLIMLVPKPSSSSSEDETHIRLSQYPVKGCPSYEALSYTWGNPFHGTYVMTNRCLNQDIFFAQPQLVAERLA